MKRVLVITTFLLLAASAAADEGLKTDGQRLGYSVGYQVGSDFHRAGLPLDVDLVIEGLMHALEGEEPRLSSEERRESLKWLQQKSDAVEIPGSEGPATH